MTQETLDHLVDAVGEQAVGLLVHRDRRVGYDSEEASSRALKRARGVAPSRWRPTS